MTRSPVRMRCIPGRNVFNLVPESAANKGRALKSLIARARAEAALYIGDDVTDEDVFKLGSPDTLLTVRVGASQSSAATYFLRDQDEVDRLLALLIDLRQSLPHMTIAVDDYPLGPALDFLRHVWRLNHALEKVSGRMEKTLGVTAQQRLIVRCVGMYPGMTAGQLAAMLHVDAGTVSAALKRLEAKKLVKRGVDRNDRRRVVITLTAKARALDRPADGTVESAVEKLLASTRRAEQDTAVAVIDRLVHILSNDFSE